MTETKALAARMLPKTMSEISFRAIFVVSFVVLFAVALMAQVLALQWRAAFPGAEGTKSLVGGVKATVYTFMSHLS